jgi:hypothetical protein
LKSSICHYYTQIEEGKLKSKYKIYTKKKRKKKKPLTPPRSSKNVPVANNCTLLPPLGNVKIQNPTKLDSPRRCFVNEAAIL